MRTGEATPDISSVEAFKQALVGASTINLMSTAAIHLNEKVFPSLGIVEAVARKANAGALARLPSAKVVVLRPVSEIIHAPGFDFVGPVPAPIQYESVFSAAAVTGSKHVDAAKRLIAFLATADALEVARKSGMEAVEVR